MSLKIKSEIRDLNEYKKLIQDKVCPELKPGTILLLSGPVGVGKTQAMKFIADYFGLSSEINSPSFAIHNRYETSSHSQSRVCIDHVDLYRLKDTDDLESTGFWDLFLELDNIIVIEWAERIDVEFLPVGWKKIVMNVAFHSENNLTRVIEISSK